MTKYRIQLLAMIVLAVLALSLLLSQQANPDSPFFGLKRVQEKIFLELKSSPTDKVDYMSGLLNKRLLELQNVVNNTNYDYVLPAASRYSTFAGQITELVVANNLTDKVDSIRNQFLTHQKILDALYVAYPKNTENLEYKYIQDDFNYLGIYLDKLTEME